MCCGGGGGGGTAKTVKRPGNNQHNPQYADYWAPLTRKWHTMPHSAEPQHTNYWAPRTRKRHQQEHRPQRPTERSDPTQHAEGRTGDCPGPRKETATQRIGTQGVGGGTAFKGWWGGGDRGPVGGLFRPGPLRRRHTTTSVGRHTRGARQTRGEHERRGGGGGGNRRCMRQKCSSDHPPRAPTTADHLQTILRHLVGSCWVLGTAREPRARPGPTPPRPTRGPPPPVSDRSAGDRPHSRDGHSAPPPPPRV